MIEEEKGIIREEEEIEEEKMKQIRVAPRSDRIGAEEMRGCQVKRVADSWQVSAGSERGLDPTGARQVSEVQGDTRVPRVVPALQVFRDCSASTEGWQRRPHPLKRGRVW